MNYRLRITNSLSRAITECDVSRMNRAEAHRALYRYIAEDCDERGFNIHTWGGSDGFIRSLLAEHLDEG